MHTNVYISNMYMGQINDCDHYSQMIYYFINAFITDGFPGIHWIMSPTFIWSSKSIIHIND